MSAVNLSISLLKCPRIFALVPAVGHEMSVLDVIQLMFSIWVAAVKNEKNWMKLLASDQ